MRNPVKSFQWFLGLCLALGLVIGAIPESTARADVIVLVNGGKIRGQIISKGPRDYVVSVPYGRISIPVKRVREVISEDESEYLRESGRHLIHARDEDRGLDLLRRAVKSNPDSAPCRQALLRGLVTAAGRAIETRRLGPAESLLAEAAGIDGSDVGVARSQEALTSLRGRLRDLTTKAHEAYVTEDVPRAFEIYQTLMNEFPEGQSRWRERYSRSAAVMGHAALADGDFVTARARYRQALEQEPELIAVLQTVLVYTEVRSAIPFLEEGNFQEAVRRLSGARDLVPDDPAILYHLGLALEGAGKLRDAARVYRTLAGPEARPIDGRAQLTRLRRMAEAQLTEGSLQGVGSDPRWRRADRNPGTRTSAHFVIHYSHSDQASEVERNLEHHLRRLQRAWFPDNAFAGFKDRLAIHLHPDLETFRRESKGPPWSHGLTRTQRRYGVILSQEIHFDAASPQFLAAELPHELAHALLPYRMGAGVNIPMWIEEGVATAEEPAYKQTYYSRVVQDAARAGTLFSLDELIGSTSYPPEPRVRVFYAQSNSVVRFLRERLGQRATFQFLRVVAMSGLDAALKTQPRFSSLGELEGSWRRWVLPR